MAHQVVLTWTASPDMPSPIPQGFGDGYNVYRGNAPTSPNTLISGGTPLLNTTFTDDTVATGIAYTYEVKAVIGGVEGLGSNIITVGPIQTAAPLNLVGVAS